MFRYTALQMWVRVIAVVASLTSPSGPTVAATQSPLAGIPSEEDAPIALLVDLTSGQMLFSRQADRRFAPASITKVMTAYTAFEQIKDKNLSLTQLMTVRPETFKQWNRVGSTMYLPRNGQATVNQLLMGVTTVSANDGAVVLAEGAAGSVGKWLQLMNVNARKLGMVNSRFATPNGWPDGGGTYTTARDLVKLADAVISRHPHLYQAYFGHTSFTFNGITQRNHDPITGRVAGADGIKTGYTDAAGFGFLGSAERDGRRLAMVVAASDRAAARDKAARALMEWGFVNFHNHQIMPSEQPVIEAKVQGGANRSVGLVTAQPLTITRRREAAPPIQLTVQYDGPLVAPIEKGAPYGRLRIQVGTMPAYTLPLLAAKDVPEANAIQRVAHGVIGLFS